MEVQLKNINVSDEVKEDELVNHFKEVSRHPGLWLEWRACTVHGIGVLYVPTTTQTVSDFNLQINPKIENTNFK